MDQLKGPDTADFLDQIFCGLVIKPAAVGKKQVSGQKQVARVKDLDCPVIQHSRNLVIPPPFFNDKTEGGRGGRNGGNYFDLAPQPGQAGNLGFYKTAPQGIVLIRVKIGQAQDSQVSLPLQLPERHCCCSTDLWRKGRSRKKSTLPCCRPDCWN